MFMVGWNVYIEEKQEFKCKMRPINEIVIERKRYLKSSSLFMLFQNVFVNQSWIQNKVAE